VPRPGEATAPSWTQAAARVRLGWICGASSKNGAFINWFEGNVAIGPSGALYVPNDNFFVYAVDRDAGAPLWRYTMPDQTWSLPAVDVASGALFVGNNNLLPLLGKNTFAIETDGTTSWADSSLGTVAASPLLTADGKVIVGGFDGFVRAYDTQSGAQLWQTATRDHIYASAALLPDGTVVVPSCDGTIYALDPTSGTLKWAFDTREPLRSSPAVDGEGNVYFGSGEGRLFVLRPDGTLRWSMLLIDADRDDLNSSPALGADAIYLGGESGEISGDGKFVIVAPQSVYGAAADGTVKVSITGNYLVDLDRTGLKLSGGKVGGTVTGSFSFTLRPSDPYPLPLPMPQAPGDPAGVWAVSRLSLPLPTILASYNQIGFDSLHYLVGLVEGSGTQGVAWMAGAKLLDTQNTTVIDPATQALVPLSLSYQGGVITLENPDGISVEVMNAVIPLSTFRMAAHLGMDGTATEGVRLDGSTVCAGVPMYGTFLETLGFCNPQTDLLVVLGGANMAPYQGGTQQAPAGVGSVTFAATTDTISAAITGSSLALADHVAAILLVDAAAGTPVTLDYGLGTVRTAAPDGTLATVSIDRSGKVLPPMVRAYLMIDTYPAALTTIAPP
jgi:outer membrane protein assembly factor BamB